MKKISKVVILFLIILGTCLFTSCIDYVQTISFGEEGYDCYLKLTVSKTFVAAAGETPEYFLKDLEGIEEGLPEGCEVNIINDDFDVGFDFRFTIGPFTNPEDAAMFYPYLSDDEKDMMIPFTLGQQADAFESFTSDSPETQLMMDSYLATTKCRFLISKSVVEDVKGACFYGDNDYLEIPFYDYGDSWCLEIPLIYFNYRDKIDLSTIAVRMF